MIGTSTQRMIPMYMEEASAPMWLSGFFQTPPANIHTTEKVTIDVQRDDEEIAIAVQDVSAGARHNENSLYTNKGFTPPIFHEKGAITAYDLIKRRPGANPFQDPNYAANALEEAFGIFRKLERKIRRSVELMASQVLQTGILTLVDNAGAQLYDLDFQAKTTHFPTVAADWGGGSETPIADLESLATVVRRDGRHMPNVLVFGQTAWQDWLADAEVQARLDNRAMQIGSVAPATRGQGATFQGFFWIGHYRFEMWTYDGFYKDPQTGNPTPYVTDDLVIMLSRSGRLDLSYGAIPSMHQPQTPLSGLLPGRMTDGDRGLDLTTKSWFTPDGNSLMVSAGTRPLTIPTAIDTFGALNTRA